MPGPPSDSSNKISDSFEQAARDERALQATLDASIAAHLKAKEVRDLQISERAKGPRQTVKAAPASCTPGGRSTSSASAWAPRLPPPYKAPPLGSEAAPASSTPVGKAPPEGAGPSGLSDMGPPAKACPASSRLPGPSGSAPSPLGVGAAGLVGLLSGKGWSGTPLNIPGPILGGVVAPASVAPTTGSRFVAPITGEGQSNTMTECREKDRVIALFPRSAFALVPDDTPDLSVICDLGARAGTLG